VVRLVNDCGNRDNILPINALLPLGSGVAGRSGFDGIEDADFTNRYFQFGHSGYFFKSKRQEATDDNWFMEHYWVPLLLDNSPVKPADERRTTLFSGLLVGLVNRTERFKWAVPVLLLSLAASLLLYQHALRRNALNAETSMVALRTRDATDPAAIKAAASDLMEQLVKVVAVEKAFMSRAERFVQRFVGYQPSYRPPVLAAAAHRLALNSRHLSTFGQGRMSDGDQDLLRAWFNDAGHFIIEDGSGASVALDPTTGALIGSDMYARRPQPPRRVAREGVRLAKQFSSEVVRYVSRDGSRVALWDVIKETRIREWNVPEGTGTLHYLLPFRAREALMGITASGQALYFGPDGTVRGVGADVTDISIGNEDRYFALASTSRVTLFDSDDLSTPLVLPPCGNAEFFVTADVISADGLYVLVASGGNRSCLFNVSAAEAKNVWDSSIAEAVPFPKAGFILAVEMAAEIVDGAPHTCLISEADQRFDLRNARKWPCRGLSGSVARTSATGSIIALPGSGRAKDRQGVHLIERYTGRTFRQLDEHMNYLKAIAIDAAGDHVLSASHLNEEGVLVDRSTKLFVSDFAAPIFSTPKMSNDPIALTFSSDGSIFALISAAGTRNYDPAGFAYLVDFFGTLQGTRVANKPLQPLPRPRAATIAPPCPGWDGDKASEQLAAAKAADLHASGEVYLVCEDFANERWIEFRKTRVEGRTYVVAAASDRDGRPAGVAVYADGATKTIDALGTDPGREIVEALDDPSTGITTLIYRNGRAERRRYEGIVVGEVPCVCRDPAIKPEVIGIDHDPVERRIYVYARAADKVVLTVVDRDTLQIRNEFDLGGKFGTGALRRKSYGASHSAQFRDFRSETWVFVSSRETKLDQSIAKKRLVGALPYSSRAGYEIVIQQASTKGTKTLSCADTQSRTSSRSGYPTLRSSRDGRVLVSAHLGPGAHGYEADRSVVIWDVATGQCRGLLGEHSELLEFWLNRDGSVLITLGAEETRVWHVPTLSLLTEYRGPVRVATDEEGDLYVSEDFRQLASAMKVPATDGAWVSGLEAIIKRPAHGRALR
jgi:WD40 repeat protein